MPKSEMSKTEYRAAAAKRFITGLEDLELFLRETGSGTVPLPDSVKEALRLLRVEVQARVWDGVP